MISTIIRVGFLTALVALVACGEAPPPPAQPPTAQAPAEPQKPAAPPPAASAAAPVEAPAARGEDTAGSKGAPAVESVATSESDEGDGDRIDVGAGLAPTDLGAAKGAPPDPGQPKVAAANPMTRPPANTTVWRVPVAGSPVRGDKAALVTMVMFTDFQCRFSAKAQATLADLGKQYGGKLRVVHKNNPLPFHNRAEPAAQLALEARAQKGDAAFWRAHDLLFAQNGKLEDPDLEAVAKEAGLDVKRAMAAVAAKKHAARIDQDVDLAADVHSNGTPHFFINGRLVTGAQAIDKFTAVIDEELAKADALVKKGTAAAKVYDALQKDAKSDAPPKKAQIPAPTKDNPSRGPAKAKVVVQVFAGFQCPFCKKLSPTLRALEAAFPEKIRVVWRHRPLAMHTNSAIASEASIEAFKQKGPEGFWKMHDLLFEDQTKLDRPSLDQLAVTAGLDPVKFAAALDGHVHEAAVKKDGKVADAAKIHGTPTVSINGYLVPGAQPLARFKRVVRLALREAR